MITKERAFTLASQWGSFMSAGDPGACMYAFHADDGRPVSEVHRLACIKYLRQQRPATAKDERELLQLIRFIGTCPLRPEVLTNA